MFADVELRDIVRKFLASRDLNSVEVQPSLINVKFIFIRLAGLLTDRQKKKTSNPSTSELPFRFWVSNSMSAASCTQFQIWDTNSIFEVFLSSATYRCCFVRISLVHSLDLNFYRRISKFEKRNSRFIPSRLLESVTYCVTGLLFFSFWFYPRAPPDWTFSRRTSKLEKRNSSSILSRLLKWALYWLQAPGSNSES